MATVVARVVARVVSQARGAASILVGVVAARAVVGVVGLDLTRGLGFRCGRRKGFWLMYERGSGVMWTVVWARVWIFAYTSGLVTCIFSIKGMMLGRAGVCPMGSCMSMRRYWSAHWVYTFDPAIFCADAGALNY